MPEVRQRHDRRPNRIVAFLRQNRFEITWLAVVALGLFLVFGRPDIRGGVLRWVRSAAAAALRGADRLAEAVDNLLARMTVSDVIGYVLILGAFVALALRVRQRLMHSSRMRALQCPKCGGQIRRVHRNRFDHLVNFLVTVRRYRCANRACGWEGIRIVAPDAGPTSDPTAAGS